MYNLGLNRRNNRGNPCLNMSNKRLLAYGWHCSAVKPSSAPSRTCVIVAQQNYTSTNYCSISVSRKIFGFGHSFVLKAVSKKPIEKQRHCFLAISWMGTVFDTLITGKNRGVFIYPPTVSQYTQFVLWAQPSGAYLGYFPQNVAFSSDWKVIFAQNPQHSWQLSTTLT